MERIQAKLENLARTEAGERHLYDYVKEAWHIVEPGTDFVDGLHIEPLCLHLEAAARGEIKNLLINIPPGTMKSLLVSVFFPTWLWISHPELRWLFASYDARLSTRDSVKCRKIIESEWYQSRWGERFAMASDQNQKTQFENDRSGWRFSTSVGGSGTGHHPDFIVIDDPHNVKQSESDQQRQVALDWWDGTISNRGISRNVCRIIIMQRLHEKDLSGHVVASGDWEQIVLPMRFEPDRMKETSLGWNDPRASSEQELLWPELFSEKIVAGLQTQLGSYRFAGQYQQRPMPRGGGMFKSHWFEIVEASPQIATRVRYWDKAGTDGGGDFTAGVRIARSTDGIYYVEDVVHVQLSAGKRNQLMLQTAQMDAALYNNQVVQVVEQEPGSGGKESADDTIRLFAGFPVYKNSPQGNKEVRAEPYAAQCEAGNVKLVAGDWNRKYIDELEHFPNGEHDDLLDGSSGSFNYIAARHSYFGDRVLIASDGEDDLGAGGVLSPEDAEGMHPILKDICDHYDSYQEVDEDDWE